MAHPGGRPPLYKEEFCERVIELLKEGASIEEIGLELNCGYSTVYYWMDQHPEFLEAIKKGREFSKGWWYKVGRCSMRDKEFNSGLWFMNMKNRFGWQDRVEQNNNVRLDETTQKAKDNLAEYEKPY